MEATITTAHAALILCTGNPFPSPPHRYRYRGLSHMPAKSTVERAKKDLRQGKSPTTAAGEFVREEIEHVRRGKHGARSPQQAIAIGLSKARRAGVPLPPPPPGKAKETTRRSAQRAYRTGQTAAGEQPAPRYSRLREEVLKREPKNTVSRKALSKQARSAAKRRRAASATSTARASSKRAARRTTQSSKRSQAASNRGTRQGRKKAA
jgi:hypothetical protein